MLASGVMEILRPVALALVFVPSLACSEPAAPPPELAPREPARPAAVEDPAELGEHERVNSGRVYVPTHSHIYTGEGTAEDLAVTLSIHNVSLERDLVIDEVRYYDTSGKLLQEYLEAPVVLAPLETVEYFVPAKDRRGGSGANFVVGWHADSPVVRPHVEAVMVRTGGPQAYAFATRGIPIRNDAALPDTQAETKEADPDETPPATETGTGTETETETETGG